MGFIAQHTKQIQLDPEGFSRNYADQGRGREIWNAVFGDRKLGQSKEDGFHQKPIPSGSYGRSAASGGGPSYKRLLQAMRSMAPGGWSDDRQAETNHFHSLPYVAIHRMCEQMSQSSFQVFHRDPSHPDGKRPVTEKETTPEHNGPYDLVRLLEDPNDDDSFGDFAYSTLQQLSLTGMALTWMVPNKLGTPMELYSIPTAIAIPQPAINPDYPDGYYRIQPVYPYGPFSSYPTPTSAVGAPIPAQWMLRIKYNHPLLRYDGFSPLTGLNEHIDEIESMDLSRWYAMKRSINPSAVMNFDEVEGTDPFPEEEIARIHAEWENSFQGPQNSGKLIISPPGDKLEMFGNSPKDMDYKDGWDQLVSFVLAGLGITKPAAGMVDDNSYSTLFATLKQFHMLTLKPICVSGRTPLITRDGAGYIEQFEDKPVEIWNGKKWSKVTVRKTGMDQELVRVRFSDGSYLDCTPNHRFSVNDKKNRSCWWVVEAKDLQPKMATETFAVQYSEGKELSNAYTLGVLFGDGRIKSDGIAEVTLFGGKMKLPVEGTCRSKERIWPGYKQPCVTVSCGRQHSELLGALRSDNESSWWDMFSLSRKCILEFLAGWFDTDGSNPGKSRNGITLHVSGRFRADMVQLLLTKCGIRSTVSLAARAGQKTNYGKRSADLWSIAVADCKDIPCHRLDTSKGKIPPCKGKYQTVKSVIYLPGSHDVYCFTENEEHRGVFNNTLTYQCDRIARKLTKQLAPFFGNDLIVEIECPRIDDHEQKNAKLQMLVQAKALTVNELRREQDFELTDEEWGKERVGAEPQQGQPGMPGAEGGMPQPGQEQEASNLPEPPQLGRNEDENEELPEAPEIEQSRPKPGKLGRESLGPRKNLNGFHRKVLQR